MLMLVGRRGFLSGLAVGSSLLLGGVPCAMAEEAVESTARPEVKRVLTSSTGDQASESEAVIAPPAGDHVAPTKQIADDSHRRRTVEPHTNLKSSRRSHGLTAITDLPIERLRRSATGDVDVHAVETDHTTLAEVMKRLAGWSDSCPLCGKACPLCGKSQADQDLPDLVAPTPSTNGQLLDRRGREEPGDEAPSRPLRAGEPAQIILDTQRRLGKSVLDGTEFGGSPELLIQWIRALDEENRRQQAMLEEVSRADVDEVEEDLSDVSGQAQVEALRNACRQLQEAADVLEEQNLFESADSIREIAELLREQSREKVGQRESRRTTP
jgi:transposase-like protein